MIKLTKAQQDQLVVVAIGAVGVIAALWYFVILAQDKELAATKANCAKMRAKLKDADAEKRRGEAVSLELTNCLEKLRQREATFAGEHDPYAWIQENMRTFSLPANDLHRYGTVSITDYKALDPPDKEVIGNFPYKWAKFHIIGQGRYHDLGKYIADFENTFPYFRIENPDLSVPGIRQAQDTDMLSFNFDIVAPQAPGAAGTK